MLHANACRMSEAGTGSTKSWNNTHKRKTISIKSIEINAYYSKKIFIQQYPANCTSYTRVSKYQVLVKRKYMRVHPFGLRIQGRYFWGGGRGRPRLRSAITPAFRPSMKVRSLSHSSAVHLFATSTIASNTSLALSHA